MSVKKFRSVTEMPGPRALLPLDPGNLAVACELTELAYGLRPWRLAPGVHKFGSVAEASADRRHRERRQAQAGRDLPAE